MHIEFLLSSSDMEHLKLRYKETSNADFREFVNALANERRVRMKNDLMITNPTSPMIEKLSKPIFLTLPSIKHFANNRGWKKSSTFLSDMNSKKAKRKYSLDLEKKAVDVTNITKWLRSIKEGEVLVGRFETAGKCKSVSSMLARWNHTEGVDSGLFISARYFWEKRIVVIKGIRRKQNG